MDEAKKQFRNYMSEHKTTKRYETPISKQSNSKGEYEKKSTKKNIEKIKDGKLRNCKFAYLMTAFTTSLKLSSFMSSNKKNWSQDYIRELLEILFQICCACYVMQKNGIMHNDLHMGNILLYERWDVRACDDQSQRVSSGNVNIQKKNAARKLTMYRYGNASYLLKSAYLPLIYDFDRSFVKEKIPNSLLSSKPQSCLKNDQCNNFVANRDFVQVFFVKLYKL